MRTSLVLAAGIAVGAAAGIGAYTFVYARGASYLTNDPAACANCHIMSEHYAAWLKSSHRAVAGCNDCHTPKGLIPKYMTKAANGFWHSFAFTTGRFPDPLRIKQGNHEITEHACRKCHAELTETIDFAVHAAAALPVEPPGESSQGQSLRAPESITCTRCHRYVGHWVR